MTAAAEQVPRVAVEAEAWFEVSTTSMSPYLRPGERVRLAPLKTEPRRGEILGVLRGGKVLLHRCVGPAKSPNGERLFLTRGDACARNDEPPWRRDEIIGRVTEVSRPGRPWLPEFVWAAYSRVIVILRRLRGPNPRTAGDAGEAKKSAGAAGAAGAAGKTAETGA